MDNNALINIQKQTIITKLISSILDTNRFYHFMHDNKTYLFDIILFKVYHLNPKMKYLIEHGIKKYIKLYYVEFDADKLINQLSIYLAPINRRLQNIEKLRKNSEPLSSYSITINPDSQCNMDCKYCFKEKQVKGSLSFDTIKTAIDKLVYKYGKDLPEVCISYRLSSEPFIDQIIFQKMVDYVEVLRQKSSKRIIIHFVTNGTILNNKLFESIEKAVGKDGYVHVSLDGPEKIHNENRVFKNGKETYSEVVKNIIRLKEKGFKVAISCVITSKMPNPLQLITHFFNLNVDKILLQPVRANYANSFNDKNIKLLAKGYEDYFKEIKDWIETKNSHYLAIIKDDLIFKYVRILLTKKAKIIRCPWGSQHVFTIDGNGDYYSCDSFMGIKDYIIGNLDEDFFFNKLYKDISTLERSPCKTCWARYVCGGTCYWSSYQQSKDILKLYNPECILNITLLKESLYLLIDLYDNPDSIIYLRKILSI